MLTPAPLADRTTPSGWRRPYAVVLACHAGVFLAFSAAFPFMSLYVQQLGVADRQAAAGWAGLINGLSTAMVAVMNPLWGSAADRWGAKAGLVRSLVLCVVGLFICSIATSPEHLLFGRLVQGFGGGANAAAIIVVSGLVPTTALATSMGLMQTAQSLSGALGPAVGGVVGDLLGFKYAFIGSAVLLAVVTVAVMIFVHDPKLEPRHAASKESFFGGLAYVYTEPRVRSLLVIFFGFHAAYQSVWTFLPLRVQDMVTDTLVGRWSGAAALGDALGIAAGASLTAWLASRLSLKPGVITAAACATAAASTVLQLVVERPELLIGLRIIVGLSYGAAVVLMRTALGQAAEPSRRGVTFGVAQSAFAGGFAIGALGGSAVIGAFGLIAAFLVSAVAFCLVAVWSVFAFAAPRAEGARAL
ncbi:MAG TPA: MFS transporter [Chloroflexota bacterium]|nr:MFS transporter [Chloroflexota bacterium]